MDKLLALGSALYCALKNKATPAEYFGFLLSLLSLWEAKGGKERMVIALHESENLSTDIQYILAA